MPPPQPLAFGPVGGAVLLPPRVGTATTTPHLLGDKRGRCPGCRQEGRGRAGPGHWQVQAGRPGGDRAGPHVSRGPEPPKCAFFSLDFICETHTQG